MSLIVAYLADGKTTMQGSGAGETSAFVGGRGEQRGRAASGAGDFAARSDRGDIGADGRAAGGGEGERRTAAGEVSTNLADRCATAQLGRAAQRAAYQGGGRGVSGPVAGGGQVGRGAGGLALARRACRQAGATNQALVVYRLLARRGWRKVAPDTKHPKSDPLAQEDWKKNCRKNWQPC